MTTNNDKQTVLTDVLALSTLEQKDRIQILLSEYSALRSEILSRVGYGIQIWTVANLVLTWLLTQLLGDHQLTKSLSDHPYSIGLPMAGIVASFGMCIFLSARDMARAVDRVRELEHEINSRAGEHLLVWETLWRDVPRTGLIRSWFSMMRPPSRSKLPPLEPSFLQRKARGSN